MNYWELIEIEKSQNSMQKLPAYNFSALGQALLDIGVKVLVGAVVLLLDYVTTSVTNGTVTLPDPAITLPVLTLILSQLDSLVIAWAKKENAPVPTVSQ